VLQEELKVAARRDAAFEICEPKLTREEFSTEEEWQQYLSDEWEPELMVQAQIVIMNRYRSPDTMYHPATLSCGTSAYITVPSSPWHAHRHTHEHQATCAGAGKDGKGKGRWMCRMAAPWGHDVERTRCVELRAFVPDEEQDIDMDAARGDDVIVRFYMERKADTEDAEMEDTEADSETEVDTDSDDMQLDDHQETDERSCWPKHLDSKRYTPIDLDGIPRGANRATLRKELKRRKNIELHRATLFHVIGGKEVETTLELALRGEEMPPGRVVHVEVRKPIEYRCASQRIQ